MDIQQLKKARESKNMTQAQVAERLGVTCTTYQYYEYGKREPNHNILCKLADLFNVSTDYLLGRNTEKEPDTIEQLTEEFTLSLLERKIIENYLSLPENMREDMMEFLQKTVREVQNESGD